MCVVLWIYTTYTTCSDLFLSVCMYADCEYLLFQNLVGSLECSRAAMAEDLANLSAQNETLKNEIDTIPSLKQKLQVQ